MPITYDVHKDDHTVLAIAIGACHMAIFQHIDRILLTEGALQNELEEEHHHRQQ